MEADTSPAPAGAGRRKPPQRPARRAIRVPPRWAARSNSAGS